MTSIAVARERQGMQGSAAPLPALRRPESPHSDATAVRAAAESGGALCTIVGIEGSFSRELGAQLAIRADGTMIGSLADGCLEAQLAHEARHHDKPVVQHFGRGSEQVDFRLPCGSALDILIDPAPDQGRLGRIAHDLNRRSAAVLDLPVPMGSDPSFLRQRHYIPDLRIVALGTGPELAMFTRLADAAAIAIDAHTPDSARLALGREPELPAPDAWTAVVLLFHDHEWEREALKWALRSEAFYIGAQGGAIARERRLAELRASHIPDEELGRIVSPIGLFAKARNPTSLALSALAEIVARYDRLKVQP